MNAVKVMHVGHAADAEDAARVVDGAAAEASSVADTVALLAARRAGGDHQRDPVRFRLIEGLARRSATHHGAARRILDERLAQLLEAFDAEQGVDPAAPDEAAHRAATDAGLAEVRAKKPETQALGPLGTLAEQVSRPISHGHEETLRYLRSTWSRMTTERQLTQALATVPTNAGPLNSHQLVHRSLALMRELSPAYLHRFMPYVDTLLWLDQAKGGRTLAAADEPRAEGRKKPSRGKAG